MKQSKQEPRHETLPPFAHKQTLACYGGVTSKTQLVFNYSAQIQV